jgi:putative membrane protein
MKINHVLLKTEFIITMMFSILSCNYNKPVDAKQAAENENDVKVESNDKEKDAQFLVNAAEISREEISLGQLAQERGKSDHVKELGKMMESSYAESLSALIQLANTKNISLPEYQTEDGDKAYKKLKDESNIDFDKAYANMMVRGHRDAISLFETAVKESSDFEIREWASATLPNLRLHLNHSLNCKKECEKI